jgi:hypothetical protein
VMATGYLVFNCVGLVHLNENVVFFIIEEAKHLESFFCDNTGRPEHR